MSGEASLRVVKLGGSLLQWPEVVDAFHRWLSRQPAMTSVVVPGGGALADQVRELDRRFGLDAATSHQLAVETMDIHAHLLGALLPESRWMQLSTMGGSRRAG